MLYCVNFGVKDCNMFVNLNCVCSCVLVISYLFLYPIYANMYV
jgi:hypothetical protein